MTPLSPIHPLAPLPAGRYQLDYAGMLWPMAARIPFEVVAFVNVKVKALPSPKSPERIREECAAEAAQTVARTVQASRPATRKPLPIEPRPLEITRTLARKAPRPVDAAQKAVAVDEDDDGAVDELKAILARRAAERKAGKTTTAPKIDTKRLANALRNRSTTARTKAPKVPTRRALTDGECHHCGVRTRIGCEHFLPYRGGAAD